MSTTKSTFPLFVLASTLICCAPIARGAIPLVINHQGSVEVSGTPFDGSGDFRFAIVDPDTGNNLWTNDDTELGTSNMPTAAVSLTVDQAIYSVGLGDASVTNMVPIPSTVFNDDNVELRIWFDDGTNGISQLSPDDPLTSVPYSFRVDGIEYDPSLPSITLGGTGNTASGINSTAMGLGTTASGFNSTAMGEFTYSSAKNSTAMGHARPPWDTGPPPASSSRLPWVKKPLPGGNSPPPWDATPPPAGKPPLPWVG